MAGLAARHRDQPSTAWTSWPAQIGFDGRYQMNVPTGETGVYTFSRDSMSTDSTDPMSDRTVHVDRYTGNILADVRFEDYSLAGKAMAVGIALHMGTMGLWSVLANTLVCLSVLFLCASSVVMWWKRRAGGLSAFRAAPAARHAALEGCRSGSAGRLAGVPDGGSNTSCGAGPGSPGPPAHCPIETRAVLIQPRDHGGRGGQAAAPSVSGFLRAWLLVFRHEHGAVGSATGHEH
jgi:hypothetical protein